MNHWGKVMFRWMYWNVLLPGKELPAPGPDVDGRQGAGGRVMTAVLPTPTWRTGSTGSDQVDAIADELRRQREARERGPS